MTMSYRSPDEDPRGFHLIGLILCMGLAFLMWLVWITDRCL